VACEGNAMAEFFVSGPFDAEEVARS